MMSECVHRTMLIIVIDYTDTSSYIWKSVRPYYYIKCTITNSTVKGSVYIGDEGQG